MSYNVDELFEFEKTEGGYSIEKYLKANDPAITEIGIPAEYNGKPVTEIVSVSHARYIKRVFVPPSVRRINAEAFWKCKSLETAELSEGLEVIEGCAFEETNLKSIVLPKSLQMIGSEAFLFCTELERVEFYGSPVIGLNVFSGCPKLPPETVAIGIVRSTDITRPISKTGLWEIADTCPDVPDYIRPDVFELLAKNNCFQNCDLKYLFEIIMLENKQELFPVAEQYGMLEDAELVDTLLDCTIKHQATEITAYLLELKKRKFGFNNKDNYDI